jgi:hypothetical protein
MEAVRPAPSFAKLQGPTTVAEGRVLGGAAPMAVRQAAP